MLSRGANYTYMNRIVVRPSSFTGYHLPFFSSWSFPSPPAPPSDDEIASQGLPLLRRAVSHADKPFLSEWSQPGNDVSSAPPIRVTYRSVLEKAAAVANYIRQKQTQTQTQEQSSLVSPFIAHSTLPGSDYIACQWGAFASAKASVPLAISHKVPELEHVLEDSSPSIILVSDLAPNHAEVLQAAGNLNMSDRIVHLNQEILLLLNSSTRTHWDPQSLLSQTTTAGVHRPASLDTPALLLYTSGTTGKPKGVVITHRNLYHQITDLVSAWEWTPQDVALHVLPLHHVHGVVNLLSCAAHVGAQLQFQSFDAVGLWKQWAKEELEEEDVIQLQRPTVFMAVPTIYAKLLEAASHLPEEVVSQAVERTLRPMRLQVSGSAALPISVLEQWQALTGHTLLERYGMTEFAMALSNPYREEALQQHNVQQQQQQGATRRRHPGHVGLPLPSVKVRLVVVVDEEETNNGTTTTSTEPPKNDNTNTNSSGALQVQGPTVFSEYWNRPEATADAFTDDGYFDTGDVAEYNAELDSYRILGRASVDILKVGGHKISALEMERELLHHPDILEVVIVGVPDDVWGQRVGMIARARTRTQDDDHDDENPSSPPSLEEIQTWCEPRLAKYKIPTRLLWRDEIPKNAMGKYNKKDLVKLLS
jgi:malonyl-CoA/methylmalonyl-CoA synthetase